MSVTGRKHNTDDIIATVLAVEPMKFIYRGRIAVFSIKVLRDERICVVAEQRPDCSEEEVLSYSDIKYQDYHYLFHVICLRAFSGCRAFYRQLIQSIKLDFTVWHSFHIIIFQRLL